MRKSILTLAVFVMSFLLFSQAAFASSTYVVQPGDTLWQISQRHNTTVSALSQANNLGNVDHIVVGQRLTLPGGGSVHTVQRGETLWQISQKYGITVAALAGENNITNLSYIEVGDRLVIPNIAITDKPAISSALVSSMQTLSRGGARNFSVAELDLFARLVHSESAGESFLGQVAVAATVLNRVDSSRYPNTLSAVIYQIESGYYQYSPVLDGRINLPANESARRAVQEAVNGSDPSLGATGFYNPRKTSNQWVRQQPVTTTIGNHVFFR
jgi:N-acetylmuramoyl-L-alanine amidase